MSVLVLANPFSGSGPNRSHMASLAHGLSARGITCRFAWTPEVGKALLATHGQEAHAVVAAGGDGSIAHVIGLMGEAGLLEVPFATFPMGNENLFARHFGFRRDAAALAGHLARGKTRPADLGTANGRLFSLLASCGLDGDVAHRLDAWRQTPDAADPHKKRRVTRASYAPHIARAICGYRYPKVIVEADGKSYEGVMAFACNLPEYGGFLRFARHAKDDDGLLDWVLLTKGGLLHGARYAFSTYLGRHLRLTDVHHGKATQITLRGADPWAEIPAQVDGDPMAHTPLVAQVRPAAFRVIVTD